jgi:hypothetical protein
MIPFLYLSSLFQERQNLPLFNFPARLTLGLERLQRYAGAVRLQTMRGNKAREHKDFSTHGLFRKSPKKKFLSIRNRKKKSLAVFTLVSETLFSGDDSGE